MLKTFKIICNKLDRLEAGSANLVPEYKNSTVISLQISDYNEREYNLTNDAPFLQK